MPEQHVTKTACNDRHKSTGMRFKVAWGLAALVFSMMSWSIVAGHQALRKVEVHTAAEKPTLDGIRDSLNRIEKTQVRMDDRMDDFIKARGE